jgi:phenylacetate-CoA ligase
MNVRRYFVPEEETLDRGGIAHLQRNKLAAMLKEVLRTNAFYGHKYRDVRFDAGRDAVAALPFTLRRELEADQAQHPVYGSNLTYPLDRYCRFHQTSGTGGKALKWLDTRESWAWFAKLWGMIFTASGVATDETIYFPFSFGPFVGFWGAFEGGVSRGNLCVPAGGMSTVARIKMILEIGAAVICCTPTYALHMAEVAAREKIELRRGKVKAFIVAGEPGGSIPEIRGRIEAAWGARVFDHTGMTEIGALGFECLENPGGVHLAENECIVEVVRPRTGEPVLPDAAGMESGELVLTNLGRWGSPLIRYRTGDLVKVTRGICGCGRSFARMEGGILGRVDDLVIIRGNNVFPTAVDALLRSFTDVAEYQVEVFTHDAMTEMKIRIEPEEAERGAGLPERVARKMQDTLNLRCAVEMVKVGELPRFEMKARRWIRKDKT